MHSTSPKASHVRNALCAPFTAVAIAAVASPGHAEAAEWSDQAASRIEAAAPKLMSEHNTPGVSVALVENDAIAWRKTFGVTCAGSATPVEHDTVFEACSMSKPLFAYEVLKLVEQGRLDLDRPLVEYLDEPRTFPDPRQAKVTARMVLTHTSGLPNWREGGWRTGDEPVLGFEPGTEFRYSGEGVWYLQQVVEHLIGERMEPWMQKSLLEPLEMTDSSYVWQDERYPRQAACGHDLKGTLKTDRPHYDRENAAFSLYTTPTDYARFLIEIMKPDRTAPHSLSAETVQAMLAPSFDTGEDNVWRGLGWAVTVTDDDTYASHSGANGTGFRCYCRFRPAEHRGIVIMTNAIGGADVWQGIMKAVEDGE